MKPKKPKDNSNRIIIFSCFLAVIFWTVDAVVDKIFFEPEKSFVECLFYPEGMEIWMRFWIIISFGILGIYARHLMKIQVRLKEQLFLHQYDLEGLVKKKSKQLKASQKQLLQSEKMASLGTLISGIAHEINNPLSYLKSNVSFLESYVKESPNSFDKNIFDAIRESGEGIEKVEKIVKDLSHFSYIENNEWIDSNLHDGIDSMLIIVQNESEFNINIKINKIYQDIPRVKCLPGKINQVILNVLINAVHSIKGQGSITVQTQKLDDQISIKIKDTGHGISKDDIKHIFDPFFTTKPQGKGMGLGLSLSYGIIKQHSGQINVKSTIGKGTTFDLLLPISQSCHKSA